jgi:hypothetical protein
VEHFLILFIIVEGQDGNSIVKLKAERVDSVVNYYNVFDVSVFYYSQIFYVDPFFCFHARVSVQTVLD